MEEKIKKGRDENQKKMRSRLDEVRDEIKESKLKFTNRGYNLLDETGCTLRQVRILHLKPIFMGPPRNWAVEHAPFDISSLKLALPDFRKDSMRVVHSELNNNV